MVRGWGRVNDWVRDYTTPIDHVYAGVLLGYFTIVLAYVAGNPAQRDPMTVMVGIAFMTVYTVLWSVWRWRRDSRVRAFLREIDAEVAEAGGWDHLRSEHRAHINRILAQVRGARR
ncbi:MAG: hypothetical protein ABWY93_22595 [Mycobacterium sp.]